MTVTSWPRRCRPVVTSNTDRSAPPRASAHFAVATIFIRVLPACAPANRRIPRAHSRRGGRCNMTVTGYAAGVAAVLAVVLSALVVGVAGRRLLAPRWAGATAA